MDFQTITKTFSLWQIPKSEVSVGILFRHHAGTMYLPTYTLPR